MDTSGQKRQRFPIWHPHVHQFFHEQLHVFLVASLAYDRKFREQIVQALGSSRVRGWCIYEVFGTYDLLVRAWMTVDKLRSFMRELQSLPSLESFDDFVAHRIHYLWSGKDTAEDLQEARLTDKLALFPPEDLLRYQEDPSDEELATKLHESDLLLDSRRRADLSDELKIYLLLTCHRRVPMHEAEKAIRELLDQYSEEEGEPKLTGFSLYCGGGAADFIVKAVCPLAAFYKIARFVLWLTGRVTWASVSSRTVINATPTVQEGDDVDFRAAYRTPTEDHMCNVLGIEHEKVDELAPSVWTIVERKFLEVELLHGFEDPTSDVMKELFLSFIEHDNDRLLDTLGFLQRLERRLRILAPRIAAVAAGKDWDETLLPRARQALRLELGPRQWPLKGLVDFLGYVDAHSDRLVSRQIGARWEPVLRDAIAWRNLGAHRQTEENPLDMWENIVDFFLEYLPYYRKVETFAEQGETKDDPRA